MKVTMYGACTVSRNIYNGTGKLTWCIKRQSKHKDDCGWVFLSDVDTDEFLNNPKNWCIMTLEDLMEIEPLIVEIYNMPVGTEVTMIREPEDVYFVDTNTGERINDFFF